MRGKVAKMLRKEAALKDKPGKVYNLLKTAWHTLSQKNKGKITKSLKN